MCLAQWRGGTRLVRRFNLVQIICEFLVKEGARQKFVLVFGPGGVWSSLFSNAPGFWGTILLCDEDNSSRYLVIETWKSIAQRKQFLDDHADACLELDDRLAQLIEHKTDLGVFRVLAEATVRPRNPRRVPLGGWYR